MNYKPLNRNIYSSNLKVLGLLYVSPQSSCGKVSDQWYFPAVPICKPEFGAPNCLVRVLKMSENPELKKGRRRLIIPFKDNNVCKELSAA